MSLTLLHTDLERWEPLPQRLMKAIETGEDSERTRHEIARHWNLKPLRSSWALNILDGCTLEINEVIKKEMPPDVGRVWRIAIGLCFFLANTGRSPNRSLVTPWSRTARKPHTMDLTAITETSEICTVSAMRTLTSEERTLFTEHYLKRKGGYELPVHFREGYWRRPPGKGNDPSYPKTVEVLWTLVNRTRLPERAIPGGSTVKI